MIDKPYSITERYLDIIKRVYSTGTVPLRKDYRGEREQKRT